MAVLEVNVGTAAAPEWRHVGCDRTSPEVLDYNGTDGTDGSVQTFVVPDGVTSLTVDLHGAEGGGSGDNHVPGGLGGRVQTTLAVTPGESLTLRVGGSRAPDAFGSGDGGYNGGGTAGHGGGGGGGATDIRRGGTVLAIAAGGGGAGDAAPGDTGGDGGAGGGTSGSTGTAGAVGTAGGGGTSGAGGAAGTPVAATGTAGSSLQGGDGGQDVALGDFGGGGGGGGYFGGGGGGRGSTGHPVSLPPGGGAGGGGGGSSYSSGTSTTHTAGTRSGHGTASISWVPAPGRLKLWTGTEWHTECCPGEVGHPLNMWDGTTWVVVACLRGPGGLYDTAEYDTGTYG